MADGSVEAVVALYKERECARWVPLMGVRGVRCTVYDKGAGEASEPLRALERQGVLPVQVLPLDNVGREAHTYLHHIVKHYDGVAAQDGRRRRHQRPLADVTLFLQGDPWPHVHERWRRERTPLERHADMDDGSSLCPSRVITDPLRQAFEVRSGVRLDILGAARKLGIDGECPWLVAGGTVTYPMGAQYAVPRSRILARPKAWWQAALDLVTSDQVNAWEIERLWPAIFGFDTERDLPARL